MIDFDTAFKTQVPAKLSLPTKAQLQSDCIVSNCSHACDCVPGMVMLRRSPESKCWLARFIGVKHFPSNELPAPISCDATLLAALEWLATVKHAQGCWVLIAP